MSDESAQLNRRRLTLVHGARAAGRKQTARLRDSAALGPGAAEMRELARELADEAHKAVADAQRSAERLRQLGEQANDPSDLAIAEASATLNLRVAKLLRRRADAISELLAYLEALPPRDAIAYTDVVSFIVDREEALRRKRQQPATGFADAVSRAIDRIESLATDLAELDGTLASCRARFGHLPAIPRQNDP